MLYCNGIDPFVTLMGNFNWRPISHNDIVSNRYTEVQLKPFEPYYELRIINLVTNVVADIKEGRKL